MKESLDRHLLAPKKREFFKLSAVAGVSGFAASHALDASGKDIRPPTTVPFPEPLPVYFAKPEALQVDPPPQEYPHPQEAGRDLPQGREYWPLLTGQAADIDEVRRKLDFYDTDPAADADIANHTGALRLGNVERDRWLMMPNKTAAAQVVRAIDNLI